MNQLLGWATSNSQQEPPTEPVDPKWIDVILGKEDAVRMRELMDVITSEQSLDTKLNAFDELELLVESLDNANDLGPLQLWNPLLDVLHSPHEDLQVFALWTIGTAIQNNAKSQTDFYASLGLSKVLDFMRTPRSSKVNQKALYCISSAIRQNEVIFADFAKNEGIKLLVSLLQDADPTVTARCCFLLSQLLINDFGKNVAQHLEMEQFPNLACTLMQNDLQPNTFEELVTLLVNLSNFIQMDPIVFQTLQSKMKLFPVDSPVCGIFSGFKIN